MLNDESGHHLVGGTFFDDEGFVLECFDGTWGGDVDHDIWATIDFLWWVLEVASEW